MGRSFSAFGGTHKVEVSGYAAINSLDRFSVVAQVRRSGLLDGVGTGVLWDRLGLQVQDRGAAGDIRIQFGRWNVTALVVSMARPSGTAYRGWALSYDYGSDANRPVVYVDGVAQSVSDVFAPVGTLAADTGTLTLGSDAAGAFPWDGYLAGAAIWNRVLAAGELAARSWGLAPVCVASGLVGWWPLAGLAAPEVNRWAGNTGAVTGTARVFDPGARGARTGQRGHAASVRPPGFWSLAGPGGGLGDGYVSVATELAREYEVGPG